MRYFHVRGRNLKSAAVISVPPETDELAFWADLENRTSDVSWVAPPARAGEGELVDWAPSNLLPRLCSEKLKRVLDGGSDSPVWLPVTVETPRGPVPYFILHFAEFGEVIDRDKSIFAGGRLLKPHLAAGRVGPRRVFAIRPLSPAAIVDDDIRRAIRDAGCTGIEFEHCPSS